MASEPVSLPMNVSHLVDVRFSRRPDGTVEARIIDMLPELITTTGVEVPDRLRIIAEWIGAGHADMLLQAVRMDEVAND